MGLNAKKAPKNGGNGIGSQKPIEIGTYDCRLVQLIELGMQPQKPYRGNVKPPIHMIHLTYEFTDEFCLDEDGNEMEDKPRWLSETIPFHNLDCDLAKSTKRYRALDPNDESDGDFVQLLNKGCHITVSHNPRDGEPDNPYQNIASATAMRDKVLAKLPELVNEPKYLDLDDPDLDLFKSLPEWIQDKITSGLEFAGSVLDNLLSGDDNGQVKKENQRGESTGMSQSQKDEAFAEGQAAKRAMADDEGEEQPAERPVQGEVDEPDDVQW